MFFKKLKGFKHFQKKYVVFGIRNDDFLKEYCKEVSGVCHTHWISASSEMDKCIKTGEYCKLCIIEVTAD